MNVQTNQAVSNNYQPSKLDKISQYLYLLYQAKGCGHFCDKEIEQALNEFKQEAGI